ncbi:MAG: hypothetical protein ACSLFH_01710 [Desulfuromonadales bacterium]
MSTKLSDFYQGNTKKWSVTFPYNVSGAVIKFRMAQTLGQADPDLEITGELDSEDASKINFTIDSATSEGLAHGSYFAEHELVMNGEVYSFNVQDKLRVKHGVPKGGTP